jgi:hypothetical protein
VAAQLLAQDRRDRLEVGMEVAVESDGRPRKERQGFEREVQQFTVESTGRASVDAASAARSSHGFSELRCCR